MKHPQNEHRPYQLSHSRTAFPIKGMLTMASLPHAMEHSRCSREFLASRRMRAATPFDELPPSEFNVFIIASSLTSRVSTIIASISSSHATADLSEVELRFAHLSFASPVSGSVAIMLPDAPISLNPDFHFSPPSDVIAFATRLHSTHAHKFFVCSGTSAMSCSSVIEDASGSSSIRDRLMIALVCRFLVRSPSS